MFEDVSVEVYGQHKDLPRRVAMIDRQSMRELELRDGDIVVLHGKRVSYALVQAMNFDDQLGNYSIRIDPLIQNNIGVKIGDHIKIEKQSKKVHPASKVTLKLLDYDYDDDPEGQLILKYAKKITDQEISQNLDKIPLLHGDYVGFLYRDISLIFEVLKTLPINVPTQVNTKTKFSIVKFVEIRDKLE